MQLIDFKKFKELSENYRIIPVIKKKIADFETPLSILARFKNEENFFLLESVEKAGKFNRFSFFGINPRGIFSVENNVAFYTDKTGKKKLTTPPNLTPVFALREILGNLPFPQFENLPTFLGGAIGYLTYESVMEFEEIELKRVKDATTAAFMLCNEMLIFDNHTQQLLLSVCVNTEEFASLELAYEYAQKQIVKLEERLKEPILIPDNLIQENIELESEVGKKDYMKMVNKAKKHIFAGDIIQVVLSHKFSGKLAVEPLQLYRALRVINPSPYTFFVKFGEKILIGASPETLVKLQNRQALVRPIAGTRKRSADSNEDRNLATELLNDEKERAEHLMLVDLGRNDLGKVALSGSVQVRDFMHIERYSHVMHLVTTIDGILKSQCDGFDLLKAIFPAGTLSGAPKVRAMQIIDDLEITARNCYGGAVGYFSYAGDLDFAITIRTFFIDKGEISVQAGAGIVFDSDAEKEYEETVNKAAGMMRALKLAINNLEDTF